MTAGWTQTGGRWKVGGGIGEDDFLQKAGGLLADARQEGTVSLVPAGNLQCRGHVSPLLTDDGVAFYDALASNDSAVTAMGEEKLKVIASAEIAANAALVLLAVACALLDRQIDAQAAAFTHEGGFTERLHRIRTERRKHGRQ